MVKRTELKQYGFPEQWEEITKKGCAARVTAVYKDRYELVCAYGVVFGRLKSSVYFYGNNEIPTVGDFVRIQYNSRGDSVILETLPRKSYFSRVDPSSSGHDEQAVAANFDYVFIVTSLNQNYSLKRIERYLTAAWQSGAEPVAVLTKADLDRESGSKVSEVEKIASGACVKAVSSLTGQGLDELNIFLRPGKTIVLLGSSGVGKSSLINALAGRELMGTGEIREGDSRGRHTTTHRQLLMLENGAMIIDTPGMRELGMWDVTEGLGQSFQDVEQYLGSCRFRDCSHLSEPGCAIRRAIESGELPRERWESYQKLKKEAVYSEKKADFLRQKQQRTRGRGKRTEQKFIKV